jgi:hypothetical protein
MSAIDVIAMSVSDETIQSYFREKVLDCFASLAMTGRLRKDIPRRTTGQMKTPPGIGRRLDSKCRG